MRIIVLILVGVFCCIGCQKDNNDHNNDRVPLPDSKVVITEGENPEPSIIDYKTCSQIEYKGDQVQICFDSLIEDSRCPIGVECVWEGTAIAKFLFTVNQVQHAVTLSTIKFPLFPSDTILMGYKIGFVNLLPYPDINSNHDPEYKAEITITKQ